MSLHVYSARIFGHPPTPHDLDISRKNADAEQKQGRVAPGEIWAPSWKILRPALDARAEIKELRKRAAAGQYDPGVIDHNVDRIERDAWAAYEPAFLDEMRASCRARRPAWNALLARKIIVLRCWCVDAERCHRRILRADILPKFGAVDCGELGPEGLLSTDRVG